MDISGLYSTSNISPIQGVSYGKRLSASNASSSLGDTVSISTEAMEKYMASKNKSEEEKEIEKTMTTWFEVVYGGFCAPKTDYSKWSTENLEQKQEIEAEIDAILAEERNGLNPLSQETLDKLEPLWAKRNVLDAFADKGHVTDDIMEKAVAVYDKLKSDWDAAHPEKSLLRSAIDAWQNIDPDQLEEEVQKRQDELLAEITEGGEGTSTKPLEEYQVPNWLVEASSPQTLYKPTRQGEEYTPKSNAANDYDTKVHDAYHKALEDNGITSENYDAEFFKNPAMNEKVKQDMYAYLRQAPQTMQLMQTWNPSLFQQLS